MHAQLRIPPLLALTLVVPCLAQQSLHKWDFARGKGDWHAANSVAPLETRDGALVVRVTGFDPYIHCSRGDCLSIDGKPTQFLRMVARGNVKGGAEFFWCASTDGADAGFVGGQEIHFTMHGDGEYHTYNVFPGWEGKVTRLRFDPPGGEEDGTVVEIKSIEILQLPPAPRSEGPVWEFAGTMGGFVPARDIEDFRLENDHIALIGFGRAATLRIANLSLQADELPWLTVDATPSRDTVMTLIWSDGEGTVRAGARTSIRVPAGKFHHTVRLAERPNWQGVIGGLQVAWKADPEPVAMEFSKLGLGRTPVGPATPELISVGFNRAFAFVDQRVVLQAKVRNAGAEPLRGAKLHLAGPGGTRSADVPSLGPGEEMPVRVPLKPAERGEHAFRVSMSDSGESVPVHLAVVAPSPTGGPDEGAHVSADQALLSSGTVRLSAPGVGEGRYGPLYLDVNRDGQWRNVGVLPPVGAARFDVADAGEILTATALRLDSGAGLRFERVVTDKAGREWGVAAEYRLTDDPLRIDCVHTLTAFADGPVHRFDGPMLRVGDGTFGAAKFEALFPGLEYLNAKESSSSDRDIVPPGDLRVVPHPNRVCIPLMAVATPEKDVVSLLWDNEQKWLDDRDQPSALFASPNLVEGGDVRIDASQARLRSGDNHLLGLFLPSVPRDLEENALVAEEPVELKRGQRLTLKSSLYVKPGGEVLDAVLAWCRVFKPKGIGEPPLPIRERYELSLRGLEEILYEAGKGWASVKGWDPSKAPGTALMYLYLAKELGRPELRQMGIERIKGVNGLPLSLHLGSVKDAILAARTGGFRALGGREPDGTWVFHPNEKTKTLGDAGDTNIGMAAGSVRGILQAAAMTADPRLLAEGLKGLDWMRQWRVPRGSQVWEIPLHAPDILASAHACEAFLWAYRLTGDRAYLDDAVYWAKTGLPFVYFWQTREEGLEPMRGGTIPIFGATFYTGSWFGRLVQWCGLEHARALLDLAEFDRSFVWERVARDILVSGWRQQQTKDGYQGLYPDSWSMINGSISWGLMLGPQRLIHYQLQLDGKRPDGDVRLFRQGKNLVSLLAPGRLTDVAASTAKVAKVVQEIKQDPFDLTFTHHFDLDSTAYVALVGVSEPTAASLPRRDDLSSFDPAWTYEPALPGVVLRLAHKDAAPVKVTLSGLRVQPLGQTRTTWTFDTTPEGWRPENHLGPLEVRDGFLLCVPSGSDPYMSVALLDVPANEFGKVVIRCRLPEGKAEAGSSLQMFWATQEGGFAPERSATAAVPAGREWHDVVVDVGRVPTWRTMLTGLRIDPPGVGLEIDEVRLSNPAP